MTKAQTTMPSGAEFVGMIAALMAVNALGIDMMLPALPQMGAALHIPTENGRQWIISAYMFGFGAMQLIYGPLADQLGRKRVMVPTLIGFAVASVVAAHATSFETIIAARVLQGMMSASSRVIAVSVVRDLYSGRQMARVMSVAQMIFFIVPILAPSLGQVVLLAGRWQLIFYVLAGFSAIITLWVTFRLPETLPVARRVPISVTQLVQSYRLILGDRFSLGYTLASTLIFGAVIGYVASSQQVFVEHFGVGALYPLLFAACALAMSCASLFNSRLVERLGTRRISHSALIGLIVLSLVHALVALSGHETLLTFTVLMVAGMMCVGLCGSNFGAMAMEPVGQIAGTAASVQGFVSTVGATFIGAAIGQAYDGTTVPIVTGFLIVGILSMGIVLITEGGQLFRARNAPA